MHARPRQQGAVKVPLVGVANFPTIRGINTPMGGTPAPIGPRAERLSSLRSDTQAMGVPYPVILVGCGARKVSRISR
jgi:hypothetical protein